MFRNYRPDRCYIIAEIGGNFTTFDQARRLIDEAKSSGVDAVKLQTYRAETLSSRNAMVGSALVRRLHSENCTVIAATRQELDLKRQDEVVRFVQTNRPDAIILAAAKVGGILANDTFPADFLYDNLIIEANIFEAAHRNGVDRLLFLGSSCIYPKFAPQPISEDALLTGSLEPTNEWYAVAKIAGIKLAEAYRKQHGRDYISAMPCGRTSPCRSPPARMRRPGGIRSAARAVSLIR